MGSDVWWPDCSLHVVPSTRCLCGAGRNCLARPRAKTGCRRIHDVMSYATARDWCEPVGCDQICSTLHQTCPLLLPARACAEYLHGRPAFVRRLAVQVVGPFCQTVRNL